MSVPKSEYKVYMYIDDYNKVCTEVYLHQQIETGGNLFGLWTTSGSAVIHVVLGPGQDCRRTTTSFHQDIEYMKRVGGFVNEGYMLCHIGEWHSHHRLSLNKPSSGDEQTVERNFPQGMSKFLVIIANIVEGGDRIVLSPYFFTHGGTRYEKAEYEVLKFNSPFSSDTKIIAEIEWGAEGKAYQRNESPLADIPNHGGPSSKGNENPRNKDSNHNGSTSATYVQAVQGSTQIGSNSSGDREEPMEISVLEVPPRDYEGVSQSTSVSRPVTSSNQNASDQHTILPPPTEYKSISAPVTPTRAPQTNTSPSSQTSPKPTKREIILKKVHDELKEWFGKEPEAMFVFECSKLTLGAVEIRFKHNYRYWMVRLPKDFPVTPATMFYSGWESSLCNSACYHHEIVEPLTDHVNILLSIKKNCSLYCKVCKNIKEESLNKSATPPTSGNVTREDIIKGLTIELEMNLATPHTFADEAQNDGSNKIKFQHNMRWWFITLPAKFPDKPAEVGVGDFYGGVKQSRSVKLDSNTRSHKAQPLNSATLIISAITSECRCVGHCSKHK